MTDLAKFDRAMKAEMEKVDTAVKDAHKRTVEIVYREILNRAAFLSGYFKSNHRIGIGGLPDAELNPPERPDDAKPGQFAGNIPKTRQQELAKLKGLAAFGRVVIGTAVPYSEELESRDQTYKDGAFVGGEKAAAEIKKR